MSDIEEWETYEQVARYLLEKIKDDLNLKEVQGKQVLEGKSGAHWEIDAKGVSLHNEKIILIECRRRSSRQNQEALGGFAYRIRDTGAQSGIIVSPLELQIGAQKVAQHENIVHVKLSKDSTPTDFLMQFMNKFFVGFSETVTAKDSVSAILLRPCNICGTTFEVPINKDSQKVCNSCNEN